MRIVSKYSIKRNFFSKIQKKFFLLRKNILRVQTPFIFHYSQGRHQENFLGFVYPKFIWPTLKPYLQKTKTLFAHTKTLFTHLKTIFRTNPW